MSFFHKVNVSIKFDTLCCYIKIAYIAFRSAVPGIYNLPLLVFGFLYWKRAHCVTQSIDKLEFRVVHIGNTHITCGLFRFVAILAVDINHMNWCYLTGWPVQQPWRTWVEQHHTNLSRTTTFPNKTQSKWLYVLWDTMHMSIFPKQSPY